MSGDLSGKLSGDLSGKLPGDLSGKLSGDLSGKLSGDLIGDLIRDLSGKLLGDLYGKLSGETPMDAISQMKTFWPDWTVEKEIGAGAYGHVYKVSRRVGAKTFYSAVKVIRIPQSDSEVKAIMAEDGSHSATKAHFRELVEDCKREITMMMDLRGTANVVEVEDFKVIEQKDEIRWDIFIRMEYLTCLTDVITERRLTEKEAAKVGIDICSALELCEDNHIIHRDIKPGNIFVSRFGTYKLGDFGIAKQLERGAGTLSSRGTYDYMAPEMFRGQRYDASVDIYALGIVLYKLLNRNRAPFLDPKAERISSKDREDALGKRINGESLPAPCDASVSMSRVILKACRAKAADRFRSPGEMKAQLENVLNEKPVVIAPDSVYAGEDAGRTDAAAGLYVSQTDGYGTSRYGQGTGQSIHGTSRYGQGMGQYTQGTSQSGQGSGRYGQSTGRHTKGTSQYGQGTGQYGQGASQYDQGTGPYTEQLADGTMGTVKDQGRYSDGSGPDISYYGRGSIPVPPPEDTVPGRSDSERRESGSGGSGGSGKSGGSGGSRRGFPVAALLAGVFFTIALALFIVFVVPIIKGEDDSKAETAKVESTAEGTTGAGKSVSTVTAEPTPTAATATPTSTPTPTAATATPTSTPTPTAAPTSTPTPVPTSAPVEDARVIDQSAAAPSGSQHSVDNVVYIADVYEYLTLREAPSTMAKAICLLPPYTEMYITEFTNDTMVRVITLGDQYAGYVNRNYIVPKGSSTQRAGRSQSSQPSSGATIYYADVYDYLTLRNDASTSAGEIDRLLPFTAMYVHDWANGMAYVTVVDTGQQGWVNASYITDDPNNTVRAGKSQSSSATGHGFSVGNYCFADVNEYLTLRDAPSTSAGEIARLPDDTMMVILELTNDTMMKVQVVSTGQVGYVNRNYVK